MAERKGKPKCFILRHEGNDGNEQMSTMKFVRRRQLGLPLQKSWACRGEENGKVLGHKLSGTRSNSQTSSSVLNLRKSIGCSIRIQDIIQSRLYYHVVPVSTSSDDAEGCGAVFNLEFSPLGDTLVTAYEGAAMQLFDPITSKLITKIPNAHSDCVNCIRFLDRRTFATGSDDKTVALWDIRNLRRKICTLTGHTNWVKSIEYCQASGLLITSAFDGDVLAWDINRYQEEMECTKLFHLDCLMRTRLTPDSSKLIMSTSDGFYLVVHDLDLHSLASDFQDHDLAEYAELLLTSGTSQALKDHRSNGVFHRPRNRAELVVDFPDEGGGQCISSLVVHPQAWCMVSRYTNDQEDQEWTCVHDLQDSSDDRERRKRLHKLNRTPAFKPRKRLLYYAKEPSDGKGYIKEPGISPDGRIISSSFSHGVRLLAFDTRCSELCDLQADHILSSTQKLKQIKLLSCHQSTVLTSRFSPTQCLLASGCLEGKVVFHHPEL